MSAQGAASPASDVWGYDTIDDEPPPPDFHNFFVLVVLALLTAWLGKVLHQLFLVLEVRSFLAHARPVTLEGMSVYAGDMQVLIRQHLNQILRIRRTVPPKPVERHALAAHLLPESLRVLRREGGDDFGVEFRIDAAAPCRVRLFWGVSLRACNELVRGAEASVPPSVRGGGAGSPEGEELGAWRGAAGPWSDASDELRPFEAEDYVSQSPEYRVPAGVGQLFSTPERDFSAPPLSFDVHAEWMSAGAPRVQGAEAGARLVPLVVVAAACGAGVAAEPVRDMPMRAAGCEVSFARFRHSADSGPGSPEVVQQLSLCERGQLRELRGIYGFEDETDLDCSICYAQAKNVLLLPCRHCSVCQQCLRSLRDEKCPLCRAAFTAYATLPLRPEGGSKPPPAEDGGPPPGQRPPAPPASGPPAPGPGAAGAPGGAGPSAGAAQRGGGPAATAELRRLSPEDASLSEPLGSAEPQLGRTAAARAPPRASPGMSPSPATAASQKTGAMAADRATPSRGPRARGAGAMCRLAARALGGGAPGVAEGEEERRVLLASEGGAAAV